MTRFLPPDAAPFHADAPAGKPDRGCERGRSFDFDSPFLFKLLRRTFNAKLLQTGLAYLALCTSTQVPHQ